MTRNTGVVRKLRVALGCAFALLIGTPEAGAQGEGVTVDPDSPSGKEYALPLERARGQADPRGVAPGAASRAGSAALFGEGVVASSGSDGQAASRNGDQHSSSKAGTSRARTGADSTTSARDRAPSVVGLAASRPATPDGGVGTPILVLGLGLLVVLIGGVAGVVIRRHADG